jgi:hypothetical protein
VFTGKHAIVTRQSNIEIRKAIPRCCTVPRAARSATLSAFRAEGRVDRLEVSGVIFMVTAGREISTVSFGSKAMRLLKMGLY